MGSPLGSPHLVVVGGGVAGAVLAWHAARAGRRVVVVESRPRFGGCLHSVRTASGFWLELGAHTCYNSYGAFLEALEGCGLIGRLQPRGKPVLRFLDGDAVAPGANLGLLLRRFDKLELLRAVPRWIGADPAGRTVREHYGRLVGRGNYERVLGPMLSAVPSQRADEFPADMLFKKRPRRKDVRRSFTLPDGLQTAVEALLTHERIDLLGGRAATAVTAAGDGFAVALDGGAEIEARAVALATPPGAAAALLRGVAPAAADLAARVLEVRVESVGFALPAGRSPLPYATFLIPLADVFRSVVTRDVVPDPDWRGFTLHFEPGLTRDEQVARAAAVLRVPRADLEPAGAAEHVLPAPRLGHAEIVRGIDAALAGRRLAVTGNWFGGLAIEDCALRSRAEWARLAALG